MIAQVLAGEMEGGSSKRGLEPPRPLLQFEERPYYKLPSIQGL